MFFSLLLPFISLSAAQSFTSLAGALYAANESWGYSPDSSWPVSDIGQPLVPQQPDDELITMLGEIDQGRVQTIIEKLVSFGTRHTLSQQNSSTRGIGAARDWLLQEMQTLAQPSNGNMEVFYDTYIQGVAERILFPVNLTNVVARINGSEDSNRAYVVTGHYDSRRIDINDYTNDAPGADDDASGVAGIRHPFPKSLFLLLL